MKELLFWLLIELGGTILGYLSLKYLFKEITLRKKFHENDPEIQQWATIVETAGESSGINFRIFILSLFTWPLTTFMAIFLVLTGLARKMLRKHK